MLRNSLIRLKASTSYLRLAQRSLLIATGTSAKLIQTFRANTGFHFENKKEFQNSQLGRRLTDMLHAKYQLAPNASSPLKTISMPETMEWLGLTSLYKQFIDPDKFFLGLHGTGACSLSAITPSLDGIKKMPTFHNPQHTQGQLYFFYGSNVEMMLHYAHLNSIHAEVIDGQSHPDFYPSEIGVLGFADKLVIDRIHSGAIPVAQTLAWIKKSYETMPDDHPIGNEIRLPESYHNLTLNLPVCSIAGTKRLSSLTSGPFYTQGNKLCLWQKGVGLTAVNSDSVDKSISSAPKTR